MKQQHGCKFSKKGTLKSCDLDTGNDFTNGVGAFEGQPPMILFHGTEDKTTPYVNGEAIYDRAQEAGQSSTLFTMEGEGHSILGLILDDDDYFPDLTTSLYQQVTKGAEAPQGCSAI